MKQKSRNERKISNFIEINGTGVVATRDGYRDVFVYGYFRKWGQWSFIVHQDTIDPSLVTISEASTGYRVKDEAFYTVEDALLFMLPVIEDRHYYFATAVNRVLVKNQNNLLGRNTTNLRTLALDTALWL